MRLTCDTRALRGSRPTSQAPPMLDARPERSGLLVMPSPNPCGVNVAMTRRAESIYATTAAPNLHREDLRSKRHSTTGRARILARRSSSVINGGFCFALSPSSSTSTSASRPNSVCRPGSAPVSGRDRRNVDTTASCVRRNIKADNMALWAGQYRHEACYQLSDKERTRARPEHVIP